MISLGEIFKTLEDLGEVNVKVATHAMDRQEGSAAVLLRPEKKVCFVLDPVSDKKKKKVSVKLYLTHVLQKTTHKPVEYARVKSLKS